MKLRQPESESYVHTLIHFRREKEANRIACTSDMTRFRLGQSDNMRYAYEERNEQRGKKEEEGRKNASLRRVRCTPQLEGIKIKRRLESHRVKNTSRDVGKFEISKRRRKYQTEKKIRVRVCVETPRLLLVGIN